MLDTLTLAAVVTEATSFFSEIQTPIFWIAGVGLAMGVANWAIAKARRAR